MNVHRYEAAILKALSKEKAESVGDLAARAGISKDSAMWALENLSKAGYVTITKLHTEAAEPTEEGMKYAKEGMPEERLIEKLAAGSMHASTLSKEETIGMQWAKSKGLISVSGGTITLTEKGRAALGRQMQERIILKQLSENPLSYAELSRKFRAEVGELAKRKIIAVKASDSIGSISITREGLAAISSYKESEEIDTLTRKMIINKEWQGKVFKKYDVAAGVEKAEIAKRHPVKAVIDKIKDAYVGMGFREIRGPIVEPAFWVFDFLFVPQDHPARDKQDTFYLSEPERMEITEKELMKSVKKVHTASWKMEWSEETASAAILRTHTTSVSAHQIYDIVKNNNVQFPAKFFSVGKVFRNENIDYKHIADFYQTDGIVVGKNLTLANLFDTLLSIYGALGVKIKFKPSYFPFVEPGVEVDIFYEPKGEWLELGGAGIIRREIIGSKKINVLAWGLGVERILLVKDPTIASITELYNNGIGWLRGKKVI